MRTTTENLSQVYKSGSTFVSVTRWAVAEAGKVVGFVVRTVYGQEPVKFETLNADFGFTGVRASFEDAVAAL